MEKMYCYVGDLLGFEEIALNSSAENQVRRIKEWIDFANYGVRKFNLIDKYQLVSDTIFVGAESSEEGLENLLKFAQYMQSSGVHKSFLLRSAITFGNVEWDPHVTFGEAVINAYNVSWEVPPSKDLMNLASCGGLTKKGDIKHNIM